MSDDIVLFDRAAVRRHRDRAAADFGAHAFLHRETAERLADRLADVRRNFAARLLIGAGGTETLAEPTDGGVSVTADLSEGLLRTAAAGDRVACDEEFLPFADGSFDLVASCLSLHWTNDLPGALIQIRRALKPDGLFLGAMLGGDTLVELRGALLEAEAATAGGTSPRTSPVAGVQDAAALMQRAGFALPVVDADTITVTYADPFALLRDLRGMGEANALVARSRRPLRRDTLFAAAEIYRARHAGADGRIPATFQLIWMTGWAPAASQPKALRPGSAAARLADALDSEEKPAGDTAPPQRRT